MATEVCGMTLLALDAGVRETGWAVYHPDRLIDSGIIKMSRSRSLETAGRVAQLVHGLDGLVDQWNPKEVAYGKPSGIRWPAPALELLDNALVNWSSHHRLPLYTYSTQEVRAAIAHHSHVPQDQLAYAIMRRLGLIGGTEVYSGVGGAGHRVLPSLPLERGRLVGESLIGVRGSGYTSQDIGRLFSTVHHRALEGSEVRRGDSRAPLWALRLRKSHC